MKISGQDLLTVALGKLGCPYVWGAKGATQFDCSGLVTWAILQLGGPDWRADHNTTKLFSPGVLEPLLPELERAFATGIPDEIARHLALPAGTLVFYGPPGGINHVMIAVGDGRVFGACGGGSGTLVPTAGASVQFRSNVAYRPGVRGFRTLESVS